MTKADVTRQRARAQVCLDLHAALGVEFGGDVYGVITTLRAKDRQCDTAHSLLREMYSLILNHEVALVSACGGIWTLPDRMKDAIEAIRAPNTEG